MAFNFLLWSQDLRSGVYDHFRHLSLCLWLLDVGDALDRHFLCVFKLLKGNNYVPFYFFVFIGLYTPTPFCSSLLPFHR